MYMYTKTQYISVALTVRAKNKLQFRCTIILMMFLNDGDP